MDLFKLSFTAVDGFGVHIHWIVFLLTVLTVIIWLFIKWQFFGTNYSEFEINEVQMGIGKHKVKIKPNDQDLQIAYQLWVELSTRKIGLQIDSKNDVISELYNSWYEFFKIARELIKSIPVKKVRSNQSTREIIDLSFKILNEGIRPHLTTWQAKYRKWYESEVNSSGSTELTPQQIQQKYPDYKELEEDMKRVNNILIAYKNVMERLISIK